MRDVAADGADSSDLRVADPPRPPRPASGTLTAIPATTPARRASSASRSAATPRLARDPFQIGNAPDVDESGRRREPHLHEGDQAVPAREQLGARVLAQELMRLADRACTVVVEGGGKHVQ